MSRPESARRRLYLRIACLSCVALFVVIALGCMSFNFGTWPSSATADNGPGLQHGRTYVRGGNETVIYFPTAYSVMPNLEFEDEGSKKAFVIVEQQPDHFRVRNVSGTDQDVAWKARGTMQVVPDATLPAAVVTAGAVVPGK